MPTVYDILKSKGVVVPSAPRTPAKVSMGQFIGPKTASRILNIVDPNIDEYHANIVASAQKAVNAGGGQLLYMTQYQSGRCRWGRDGNEYCY